MTLAVLLFLVIVLAYFVKTFLAWRRKDSLPRGPYSLPIFGNYLQFPPNLYEYAYDLSKQYGPIFRLRFGSTDVIILNEFDLIRDALSRSSFASRPEWTSMTLQSEFHSSFAFRSFGPHWRFLRKQSVKAMTILKNQASKGIQCRCERAVNRLIKEFTTAIEQHEQQPKRNDHQSPEQSDQWSKTMDPSSALFRCVCTIMGETCFGRQFDPDDPELWAILNSAQDTSRLTKIGSLTDCFPWAKIFMGELVEQMRDNNRVFSGYVVDKLDRSYENADNDKQGEVYDLTDALRLLTEQGNTNGNTLYNLEEEKLTRHSAVDLFGAGLFTTLTTLEWALLVLGVRTDITDKMRQEMRMNTSEGEFITLDDRPQLPYVEATILEVLRFSTTLPFGVPHCTTETVQIDGYTIPKDTPILCNIWAVHHDERTFEDPFEFNPDRFILKSDTGQCLNSASAAKIIPFLTGIRRCPGENLARQNLFLILSNIVKRLEFVLVSEYDDFNRCECNFSRKPLQYKLKFRAVR